MAPYLPSSNIDNKNGDQLYQQFKHTAVLNETYRLDEIDPDSIEFNSIIEKVREDKMTEADRETLASKCSVYIIGLLTFKSRGFDDDRVSHLFCINKDADNYNNFQIPNLQKSNHFIAKITTENAAKALKTTRQANGLSNELFVHVE